MSDELTERVIGAAIEVHRVLGPGLLKSIYEDLFIESQLVVELKSLTKTPDVAMAQVLSYLKATGCKRALLLNFGLPRLAEGVHRVSL